MRTSPAMTVTRKFIERLQEATSNEPFTRKFWEDFNPNTGTPTFKDFLDKYDEYYTGLSSSEQKEHKGKISEIFWEQVKSVGTPIIEDRSDGQCDVYFLYPKAKLSKSEAADAKEGATKNLYLQGDFHGYNAISEQQRLLERGDPSILWHRDIMPKDSVVVYQYVQAEPGTNVKPQPERAPFFTNEGFTVHEKKSAEISPCEPPKISPIVCVDEYSQHNSPYRFSKFESERVFRVSTDTNRAYLSGDSIKWHSLLGAEISSNTTSHFVHHTTLYSTKDDKLVNGSQIHGKVEDGKAPVTENYHMDLNSSNPPYNDFTRHIHVFKPQKGEVDNLVVVNDGRPYLIAGILEHLEKMVAENKLSPNTAFVFINTLPKLEDEITLPHEAKVAFKKDPMASNQGMGERLIDYKYGIEQYIDFIEHRLFPKLKEEKISVPENPRCRVMMGSSLSGTASVYIGLKRPDLFGTVIAQSPSDANKEILSKIPKEELEEKKVAERDIYLSAGKFEHPNFAAANAFFEYAEDLADKLHKGLHRGNHGHQFVAWNEELERSLPFTLMTFHQFDQSENGVRKLIKEKRFEEAAVAITHYLSDVKGLTAHQKCLLNWHAGQTYAKCGKNDLAIHYFNLAAQEKEEMIKIFGPGANYYYQATLAFLNKDRKLIEKQLQEIMKIPIKDYPPSNVVLIPGLVNTMLQNFDATYSGLPDIQNLPPLPGQNSWYRIEAKSMQEEGQKVFEYRVKVELEKMLQSTNDRFGKEFDRFCKAVGEEFCELKSPMPLSSSEKNFIDDHNNLDYPPSALAIKRRQNLTAILSSEKGIEALEQKLVSLKDIMAQPHPHHLRALFSEHGYTALKEGLITPKDVLRFGENSSQYLDELCTENGLTALRTAKTQGNLDSFISAIIQHANRFNNAGALEHSLKTGIPLDKVQSDIENSVQRPRLG